MSEGKTALHFPFASTSEKAHELWMRASQQRENLIPDQTALGSLWSCPPAASLSHCHPFHTTHSS